MGSWGLVVLVVLVGVEAEVLVEEVVTSPFGIEMWSKQAYKWSKRIGCRVRAAGLIDFGVVVGMVVVGAFAGIQKRSNPVPTQ